VNIVFFVNGIRLGRDFGDKPIRKESTVTYHLCRILNSSGDKGRWVRCYPNRMGLTDSRQGVRNTVTQEVYWHERYQIEAAHKAFNNGSVFFNKA